MNPTMNPFVKQFTIYMFGLIVDFRLTLNI